MRIIFQWPIVFEMQPLALAKRQRREAQLDLLMRENSLEVAQAECGLLRARLARLANVQAYLTAEAAGARLKPVAEVEDAMVGTDTTEEQPIDLGPVGEQ